VNTRSCIALWAASAVGACVNTDVRTPPDVIFADFDPAASPPKVPTPTDLARDPVTGKITVPLAPDASAAEHELASYLESLDAFPPASHAAETFSAALAPAPASAVVILDLTTQMPVPGATVTVDGQRLSIIAPGGAWTGGHTYAIALTSALRGADGRQVVASPAFFFARSTKPLSNCTSPGPGCTSASATLPLDQAIGLERLRQALAPLFAAFELAGVPRDQIVVAWTFTISTLPFGAYDPAALRIPFPNDILRDPVTGQVQLPIAPDAPPPVAKLENELNQLQGFSTTGQVTAPVDLPPGDALPMAPTGVATSMPNTVIAAAGDLVVLAPRTPLPPKTQFLNALTRATTDVNGVPLEPPPLMVLLLGEAPLVAGGHSTVSVLSDSEAARLEPLRQALNQALPLTGLTREQIVVAWAFTTQPTITVLTDRIAAMPPAASTGAPTPIPPNVPHMFISTLIAGTMVGSKGDVVPYLLTLPQTPRGGLVIFQHGLGSDKTAMFALADTFARAGFATVAIDLPLHGDRALPNVQFLDFSDLGAIRENLLQGASDLAQLVRTIQVPGLGGHAFSGTPSFVGVSLGGIVGTTFEASQPPMRTILSTTGAPLVDIALQSPTIAPMVQQALAAAGIQPGTPQFDQFIDFARWELDAGDPINYAQRMQASPVLMQLGSDDMVIPPNLGQNLARLSRAQTHLFAGSHHALLINPMDPNIAAAQAQAAAFLLGGAP
jgi:pimeloyl-ACP methyl ester carboxylesterase